MIANARQLELLFEQVFLSHWHTRLLGGAAEPEYYPSKQGLAEIHYRADYVRSALHEVAHWCIAGTERRKQHDYGYWYQPDGRSADQQKEFFRVELKPQALEWVFSLAAGVRFEPSLDNLGGNAGLNGETTVSFSRKLAERVDWLLQGHLNQRSLLWVSVLLGREGATEAEIYGLLRQRKSGVT